LKRASSNSWTESGLDITAPGVLADAGDLVIPDDGDWPTLIDEGVSALCRSGARPLVLGGDHAITYPIVRAIARDAGPLQILHLDAHPDLYDSYEGDRLSHACPFARIMESGLASRLIQVGIRTLSAHQRDQIGRFGVETHEMRSWNGPFSVRLEGPAYLSLDLDVLDPAFIDGNAHPEPGGLSVRDVVTMIQRFEGRLVGADVVECNPVNDPSPRSALVAAKLVKELIAAMHR
jgi:agmatinase